MTRVRLRPAHDDAMLALLYAKPHSHDRWPDHVERVRATIELAAEFAYAALGGIPAVIADLSCGDAAIPRGIAGLAVPGEPVQLILGDIAPGYEHHGPVERTLARIPHAGLLVCCETIEHLDDPDAVLALARAKADALVLSTPLGEFSQYNPEHYWGWDKDGVRLLLTAAGWAPAVQRDVSCEVAGATWRYQIWGCT